MKKSISILLSILIIMATVLEGCGNSTSSVIEETTETVGETTEILEINIFDNVEVKFEGWESKYSVIINTDNCSEEIKKNVSFFADIQDNEILHNGDIITVSATCSDSFIKKYNLESEELTNTYEVSNLKSILRSEGYKEDVAWIQVEASGQEYWGCYDKEGTELFRLASEDVPTTDFANSVAIVNNNKIIDKNGNEIWSIENNGWNEAERIFGEDACTSIEFANEYKLDPYNNGIDSEIFYGYTLVNFKIDTFEMAGTISGVLDNEGNWYLKPSKNDKDKHYIKPGSSCGIYTADNVYAYNILNNSFINNALFNNDDENHAEKIEQWRTDYKSKIYQGLFFDGDRYDLRAVSENCYFFDEIGNKVIDLSKYTFWGSGYQPYFVGDYCLLDFENGYYTIIDKSGNFMFDPRKKVEHGNVADNLVWIEDIEDSSYKYIKMNGEDAFDKSFQKVSDFSCGLAYVKYNDYYHYIDTDGNVVF